MRFTVEPKKWEISDEKVRRLDRERSRLNRLCSMLELQAFGDPNPCLSLTTIEKVGRASKRLDERAKRLKERRRKLPKFDRLVLQDISTNARAVRAHYNWAFNHQSDLGIGQCISSIFGQSSFTTLKRSITPEEFPHAEYHQLSELMHSISSRVLDSEMILGTTRKSPLFQRLRAELLDLLNRNQETTNQMYKDWGVLKEVSPYKFELAPPGWKFSFWQGPGLMAAINPDRFYCHNSGKEKDYEFFTGFIPPIGAHELAHGLHEILSNRTMPEGLRPGPEEHSHIIHGASDEGVAILTEKFCLEWMQQHRKELGLTKRDLTRTELSTICYVPEKMQAAVYNILQLEETQEALTKKPGSLQKTAEGQMSSLTGIKFFGVDRFIVDDRDSYSTLAELPYFFGQRRTSRLVETMEQGGVPRNIMTQALMTGFWCDPEAQERFILDLYIPQAIAA